MIPILKPNENYIEFPRTRIELISTTDPYTRLKAGDRGYAYAWNRQPDNGQGLLVRWDNGSSLFLIQYEDDWKEL